MTFTEGDRVRMYHGKVDGTVTGATHPCNTAYLEVRFDGDADPSYCHPSSLVKVEP